MLDIESDVEYSNIVTRMEYHTHKPYASSTFKSNDEIRIPISQQDVVTVPFESTLYISGKVTGKKADGTKASVSLVNNAMAFLFEDIRYEICGVEFDRTRNLGVTSTIKNLLSVQNGEQNYLQNACWLGPGKTLKTDSFSFSIPLRLLLGFVELYRKVVVNVKQELILLRSSSDRNAVVSDDATEVSIEITNICWRMPHVAVSETLQHRYLGLINKDTPIKVPFRSWELHEYPNLPVSDRQSWTIRTSGQLEKPRYIALTFQTKRKEDIKKNMSEFDHCDLNNVKLYLNSQFYPYDNVHGDLCIFYEMFYRFQNSYHQKVSQTTVDLETFKNKTPLYVIDCSHQNDTIKSGPVDVRLEFETKKAFPAETAAYCLLIHDSLVVYSLLTGNVQRIM